MLLYLQNFKHDQLSLLARFTTKMTSPFPKVPKAKTFSGRSQNKFININMLKVKIHLKCFVSQRWRPGASQWPRGSYYYKMKKWRPIMHCTDTHNRRNMKCVFVCAWWLSPPDQLKSQRDEQKHGGQVTWWRSMASTRTHAHTCTHTESCGNEKDTHSSTLSSLALRGGGGEVGSGSVSNPTSRSCKQSGSLATTGSGGGVANVQPQTGKHAATRWHWRGGGACSDEGHPSCQSLSSGFWASMILTWVNGKRPRLPFTSPSHWPLMFIRVTLTMSPTYVETDRRRSSDICRKNSREGNYGRQQGPRGII